MLSFIRLAESVEDLNYALVRAALKQKHCGGPEHGMHPVRINFHQRHKDKASPLKPWMRDNQVWLTDY
jgi:hypothetical protein